MRRRPGERVRCYSLGVSPVAARRARAKERRGGDRGGAARYRRRVSVVEHHALIAENRSSRDRVLVGPLSWE